MKLLKAILLSLFIVSCATSKNQSSHDEIKQPMTCREAAFKIYEELSDQEKKELEAISTINEFRENQGARNRVYIDSPYFSYLGVNESCAPIVGKERVHFEILPFILTEWVWIIVQNNMVKK